MSISHAKKLPSLKELVVFLKEMLDRSERSVKEHKEYDELVQKFSEWYKNVGTQLDACTLERETEFSLPHKISKLKELFLHKEEGLQKLHDVQNQAEVVARRTCVPEREKIETSVAALQLDMEKLIVRMKKIKEDLETAQMKQQAFKKSCFDLTCWLNDVGNDINFEELPPATFSEQKSRLERLKVRNIKTRSPMLEP